MTIAAALLLFMQVSAPGPENASYLACMTASASAVLAGDPSRAEFRRHIAAACQEERARLRRVLVAQQTGKGRSRAQAEAEADAFFAVIALQLRDLQPLNAR